MNAHAARPPDVDVVIPTIGRPSLVELLRDLDRQSTRITGRVVVVDDRPPPRPALRLPELALDLRTVASGGRGPAFARNAGWVSTVAPWVAFVDDDVRLPDDWAARLHDDIDGLDERTAASQARLLVPLPADRPPTDWERSVAGLATAPWITADLAVRRAALEDVGGFDPRFRRAYREDSDLAVRLRRRGWTLSRGDRTSTHPVGRAPWWVSAARQRGNAEDARMRVHHGGGWRRDADAPRGTRRRHAAWCATVAVAVAGPRPLRRPAALCAVGSWLSLTVRRAMAGPRRPGEWIAMAATSAAIPPLAIGWWVAGWVDARRRPGPRAAAFLFDRDGTLVDDVPFNGDPALVQPRAGAAEAVALVREAGRHLGVVSNQSGVGRGLLSVEDVEAVNARVSELLGEFGVWRFCPHGPDDGCTCRKPLPGMISDAADDLGVRPEHVVVIGDIGSDVAAATAAGSRAVLVPTPLTRTEETASAPVVMAGLAEAVHLSLLEPVGARRTGGAS